MNKKVLKKTDPGPQHKIHYETRNFISEALPFSMHTDRRDAEAPDYVNQHRDIEVLAVRSGAGLVIVDHKPISISGEEIVLINSNKAHNVISDQEIVYDCLIIDVEFMTANGMDPGTLCFEEHFSDPVLSGLIRRLDDEWQYHDGYRRLAMRAILIEILVRLCRFHVVDEAPTEKENRPHRKIKHAIRYIKNNFRRELTLDEIAEEAGLSKYYFCREFRKATGMTPIEYINCSRCEWAKNLLQAGQYPVYEIAGLCGFTSSAHFSKTFHRFYGVYPSHYENLCQNEKPGEEPL